MQERSRLVGAALLDLAVGDRQLRVALPDPSAAATLREVLGGHLLEAEAEVGFNLSAPRGASDFYVLTDRSGFVLGRTRQVEEALSIVAGHLGALLPPEPGCVRLHLRAAVGIDGQIALLEFPVLWAPPVVERRLAIAGWRIVDRLTVDIDVDSGEIRLPSLPWPGLGTPGVGHCSPSDLAGPISVIVTIEPTTDSDAARVQRLSSSLRDISPDRALHLATRLARSAAWVTVPGDDPRQVYPLLEELSS